MQRIVINFKDTLISEYNYVTCLVITDDKIEFNVISNYDNRGKCVSTYNIYRQFVARVTITEVAE